ncbi:acyltransferase [Burkholderia multivorans]|uniref:acyltransferase family protein n=1 Tax=Burkholderia multivorans TaxID=87883 RepID=UPI001B8E08B2|nr:acyltransferase [Burkholderia multivorans]MBR8021260.1 acyltransferase [Burkholderia multivorans]MBU9391881.1 acyltransferase [Burkholderia multivorans]
MQREIKQLTGLRGIAACVVAVSHLDFMKWAFFRFIAFHNLAVDLFFCLSAFTLCLVYKPFEKDRLDMRAYGVARFARIYPLYLFALLFSTVTFIAWITVDFQNYDGSAVLDFTRQLLMLNALPVVGSGTHWNLPSWSLSVEAFCYVAIFPPLFYATRRSATAPEWTRSLTVLALSAIAFFMLWRHFDPTILGWGHPSRDPLAYWTAIVRALCSFIAGWLVYISWKNEESMARFAMANADTITAVFFLVLAGAYVGAVNQLALVFVWPLMVVSLMNGHSWTARFLSLRLIVWLGHLSYSIYLWHVPVYHVTMKLMPTLADSLLLRFCVQVFATLVISSASFYFVERPSRDLIRKLLMRKSTSVATV